MIKRLILAAVLLVGFVWVGGVMLATRNVRFKDEQSACMFQYWVVTWPVWKFLPHSAEQRFVNWTADKCVAQNGVI